MIFILLLLTFLKHCEKEMKSWIIKVTDTTLRKEKVMQLIKGKFGTLTIFFVFVK